MQTVTVLEAEKNLPMLIDAVMQGNEILITLAGKPVAKLEPVHTQKKRTIGVLKGKIKIAHDFDAPLEI